jgi:hypothetical protein
MPNFGSTKHLTVEFSNMTFSVRFLVSLVCGAAVCSATFAAPNWASMTISTNGFGDIKIGQTQEEIQKAIGENLRKVSSTADTACYFTPTSEERLILRFKTGKLVSIDTASSQVGVTRSGLRVGDAAEKARNLYNKDTSFRESKSPFDGRPVIAVGGGANQVAFATTEGKVDLIRLGVAADLWGRCE